VRIAMAGFSHETNTYCPQPTDLDSFVRWRGDKVVREASGTHTVWGGFVDTAREAGCEVIAAYTADAVPSGTITSDAYATMKRELIEALAGCEPFDAIALNLHGAAVAEGCDDVEGDLCAAVRAVVGERPVAAVFDLHGNLTQTMCDQLDVALAYLTYPHLDSRDRGAEAIERLVWLLAERTRPSIYLATVPMLLPLTNTNFGPGAAANRACARVEARSGVFDCTLMHGFPYSDHEHANASVLCTAVDDHTAREGAEYVAKWLWTHREEFHRDTLEPAAAVAEARRLVADLGGPIVINETDDNPGGGAPGDGTRLLRALIASELPEGSACFGFVWDPETAAQAHAAGVGALIDVRLGGKHDGLHGEPIEAIAEVRAISEGRWVLKKMGAGSRINLREMAWLRIEGIDVIVSTRRQQTLDDGCFEIHDLTFDTYDIVALKSSNHFRAFFEPFARAIVTSDGGGLTSERAGAFPRTRDQRTTLWPLR
jgi:microcystin degradation protein MlrC